MEYPRTLVTSSGSTTLLRTQISHISLIASSRKQHWLASTRPNSSGRLLNGSQREKDAELQGKRPGWPAPVSELIHNIDSITNGRN
jgi:hypothetical protein